MNLNQLMQKKKGKCLPKYQQNRSLSSAIQELNFSMLLEIHVCTDRILQLSSDVVIQSRFNQNRVSSFDCYTFKDILNSRKQSREEQKV